MAFGRDNTARVRPALVALVVLATLVTTGAVSSSARAAGPSLTIMSPADHAVIGNGTPVTVIFVVSNFNLTEPGAGGPGPTPGEGYVNVYVDGNPVASVGHETVVLRLPSGIYDIALQLVLANGTPLNPDVRASITLTVTQGPAVGTPRIEVTYVEITFPTAGVVLNDDVTVSFRVTDFAVVPPGKAESVPNEGHVAVYVDGVYYQAVFTYDPVFFSDLTDGDHTITMQLVDDSGHPLTPDISSSTTFRIQSSPVVDITPYLLDLQIVLAVAIVIVLFYRGSGLDRLRSLRTRLGRRKE